MTKMEYEINIEFSNVIDYIKFKINELHKLTGKYPDYLILGQLSSNRLNLELGPLKRFNEVETENVIEFCGIEFEIIKLLSSVTLAKLFIII